MAKATAVRSAAVYARISSDPSGAGLGVERQLADCRRLATERGWVVAQEYVDNDQSAYSGKGRPQYGQMLADLADGRRDAVLVYNLDRLHRRPVELEEFIALCERAGITNVATVTADIDLGNDDGLFMARIFAAFAAKESGRKSARVRRKMQELAEAGVPHGAGARPFGYELDLVTMREPEAVIVRELVARFLAGESVRSLATWLQAEGVPTVSGAAVWNTTTLRTILASPRIAGLREHRGEVIGPAVWPGIITPAQRDQVLARMAARRSSGRRAPRRYLLSGLLRCGRCQAVLYSQARHPNHTGGTITRRYVCLAGPDHGGCGRLTVVAAPVEELITEAVLTRLDSPELAAALRGATAGDADLAALSDELAQDQAQLEELSTLYVDKLITAREWIAARDPIQARIRDRQTRLARATDTGPAQTLAGQADQLRARWAELVLDRQHAIIRSVLDNAVIAPGAPGARSLDIDRVQPLWRL